MTNASLRTHIVNNVPTNFEDTEFLAEQLDLFTNSSIRKYIKGHLEHGGSILRSDRNLFQEAYNEVIDLNFYLGAIKKKLDSISNALELELSLATPNRDRLEQILKNIKSI